MTLVGGVWDINKGGGWGLEVKGVGTRDGRGMRTRVEEGWGLEVKGVGTRGEGSGD